MTGNCKSVKNQKVCKHLVWPKFISGFTGKSGPEAWWHCALHKKPIRHIKKCKDMIYEKSKRW